MVLENLIEKLQEERLIENWNTRNWNYSVAKVIAIKPKE